MKSLKRRFFSNDMAVLPESPVSARAVDKAVQELILLFSTPPSANKRTANRQKQLFSEIFQQARPFIKMPDSTENEIIYGDPDAPNDQDRQIRYVRDSATGQWIVTPGKQANALIPDSQCKQLITVTAGEITSYGEEKLRIAQPKPKDKLKEALAALDQKLRPEHTERLQRIFGTHQFYAFEVTPAKQDAFLAQTRRFMIGSCNKAVAETLPAVTALLEKDALQPKQDELPYTDTQGHRYVWFQADARHAIGVMFSVDGKTLHAIVPEALQGKEYVFLLEHDDIHKKASVNRAEKSVAGAQMLYIKRDGTAQSFTQSLLTDGVPFFSGEKPLLRIPAVAEVLHRNAGETAAESFLAGKQLATAQVPSVFTVPVSASVAPELPRPGAVARLVEQRSEPAQALPRTIQVTSLNGTPMYEVFSSFASSLCTDENFLNYSGTVYVMKRIGGNFEVDQGMPDSFIIEVRNDSREIRLVKGEWKQGGSGSEVCAKITIDGKYQARIEKGEITFDEKAEGTPFRKAGFDTYMCLGCLGRYSESDGKVIHPEIPRLLKEGGAQHQKA